MFAEMNWLLFNLFLSPLNEEVLATFSFSISADKDVELSQRREAKIELMEL